MVRIDYLFEEIHFIVGIPGGIYSQNSQAKIENTGEASQAKIEK